MKRLKEEDYFYIYRLANAKQINVYEENLARVSWNWRRVYKRLKKKKKRIKNWEPVRKPKRVHGKEYTRWREQVLAEADYRCVICGTVKNPEAHHIESYHANHELRLDPDNGVVLCKSCHHDFHKMFGIKNNNEEQWRAYYSMKR